jgi:hypothetical protein
MLKRRGFIGVSELSAELSTSGGAYKANTTPFVSREEYKQKVWNMYRNRKESLNSPQITVAGRQGVRRCPHFYLRLIPRPSCYPGFA